MYSNTKWVSTSILTIFLTAALPLAASAQRRIFIHSTQSLLPPDEARDLFNAGLKLYDESRFSDAESKFREVVRRFPKNPISDRADYYLIRTLVQTGKRAEALSRIDAFSRQYPKSNWQADVQEFRIQLTNQIPPRAETILLVSAPPAPPAPPSPVTAPQGFAPPVPPVAPMPPIPPFSFSFGAQSSDPEISLQQEVLRALFHSNVDHAIEIAAERLKTNPADPVVLASLNLMASSRSPQAMSMLLGIVKSSPNAKARRDAIYWLGQSRGDRDAIVDTLVGLIPSLSEDDSEAVAFALSQVRSDKALNALATIARDKSKNEKVRTNSVFWISQSRGNPGRVALLEDIYKNSMDNSKIRQQVMFALSQTREPQAVTILGNVAMNDPDIEVRKQAVYWLGQSRSPEANQALEKLLQKK